MATIDELISLLEKAKEKGCTKVRLQAHEEIRLPKTAEFKTDTERMDTTEPIISKIEGDTFTIRIPISDSESLLNNLGIEEEYNH